MYFVKRDILLFLAVLMISLAALIYLDFIYAVAIGALIFFGLKAITSNRRAAVEKQVGEGVCAHCGAGIAGGRCPDCDPEP